MNQNQWEINTNIGGSRLVAFHKRGGLYIDVRKDVRPDRCEVAEVVRNGFVIERMGLSPRYAPEKIVKLMRFYSRVLNEKRQVVDRAAVVPGAGHVVGISCFDFVVGVNEKLNRVTSHTQPRRSK